MITQIKVAGAISNIMRNQNYLDISTVGAGSLNQAIKAIAIARGFLIPSGIDIYIIPSFKDIMIGDKEKTAIKIRIEKK